MAAALWTWVGKSRLGGLKKRAAPLRGRPVSVNPDTSRARIPGTPCNQVSVSRPHGRSSRRSTTSSNPAHIGRMFFLHIRADDTNPRQHIPGPRRMWVVLLS